MRSLPLFLLLASSVAAAGPKQKPAPARPYSFAKATTYQSCSTSWAFACGMHDAGGNTYGTAHEMKMCTKYTFQANGTYTSAGDGPGATQGRYLKHDDGSVTLFEASADKTEPAPTPYDLQLSKLTLLPE
ncbi:hypothetical protein BH11MYX2_BH11MYX2_18560 [soil metagenome]